MKPIQARWGRAVALSFIILNSSFCLWAQGQSGYSIVSRGPDWSLHQKTVLQNGVTNVHQYVELATGLNFTNAYGQLTPSVEQITILPTGGACATQGLHQVYFPGDIGAGVLQVTTPDGRKLQSRPFGICYDDGSNTVCIATLTNAVGYLTSSNQVTYRNAFNGLDADLVCTYRKGGFECDLVFRQQPPAPDQFGLDAGYTTLELVTEFFNTQDPQQIPAASDDYFGLQDYSLVFGHLTMTHGKAFAFRGTNSPTQTSTSPVYKSWQHIGGRTFLIEAVPLLNIVDNLNALPLQSSITKPDSKIKYASNHPVFPPSPGIIACTNRILLAAADFKHEPGVVLDYNTVIDGSDTYTFGSGTYYISGVVNLTGTTTIGPGVILKYDPSAQLWCDSVTCTTTADQPAVLTSANDDSVGDVIAGSTGTPVIDQSIETGGWNNPGAYLCFGDEFATYQLQHLRVKYAHCVVADMSDKGGSNDEADDCQFTDCGTVFLTMANTWALNNDLFSGCQAIFADENGLYLSAVNVTADHCWTFINDISVNGGGYMFTNCLITDVTTMMAVTNWSGWVPYTYPAEIYLDHTVMADTTNGFWVISSVNSSQIASAAGIYASAAAASNYLAASSSYHNAGTTNIDPSVLAELQTMTTYTPQDGGFLDTNGTDLGYHYSVNDDSDFDGIPDWWIYQYFGNYNYNGTNIDVNGNTFLTDYQNDLDPNVIQFSFRMANQQHFNTTNATGSFELLGGVPSYESVLVNSEAFTNAVWTNYDGLVHLPLGPTDGVYQVWIGLKGFATNATPTWFGTTVYLDRVPPQLVITNPVVSTVSVPWLQVQGMASEELSSLTYDLSNAVTVVTNQSGNVTGSFLDTNLYAFTTNYFQCYDVLLTNGQNLITVHATDLAGNTTNCSFMVTLDYSTATNPTVCLCWPQNGDQLCGSSFVIRGWTEDAAATVCAVITDTNGDTNVVSGSVERTGRLWVQNLPLNSGTNWVTLYITNSAGLPNTTNFFVIQNPMTLTLTSVNGDLWLPTVSVGGQISDPTAPVWVNGVQGTNNGDGTWSADNVPVPSGGMASFDVSTDPPNAPDPKIEGDMVKPDEQIMDAANWNDMTFVKSPLVIPTNGPPIDEGERTTVKGQFTWGSGGTVEMTFEGTDTNANFYFERKTTDQLSPDGRSRIFRHYTDYLGNEYDDTNTYSFQIENELGSAGQRGTYGGSTTPYGWNTISTVKNSYHLGNAVSAGDKVLVEAADTADEQWPEIIGVPAWEINAEAIGQQDSNGLAFKGEPAGINVKDNALAGRPLADLYCGASTVQPTLSMISVDATDPQKTIISYALETNGAVCGDITASAHFTAPKVDDTKKVSGKFTFTYNQSDLSRYEDSPNNVLNLTVDTRPQSCTSSCPVTVKSSQSSQDNIACVRVPVSDESFNGFVLVLLNHGLDENFWCISYCAPATGKTLWVGHSHSYVVAPQNEGIIPTDISDSTTQTHTYVSSSGDQSTQQMSPTEGEQIGSENSIGDDSSVDEFFPGDATVTGTATLNAIIFDEDGMPVVALPSVIPPGNLSVSATIQCK